MKELTDIQAPTSQTDSHGWVGGVRTGKWRWIALAGVVLLAQAPLLVKFFHNLWVARPHYQFFPVMLVAAGWMGWSRWNAAAPQASQLTQGCGHVAGGAVLAIALASMGAASFLYSSWLAAVTAWLVVAGAVLWRGGWALARILGPSLIALLLIIPPPMDWDVAFALWLRSAAVKASSYVLDAAGVPHVPIGNVIEVPTRRLLMEEACSGINSFLSVLALTLLLGLWRQHRPLRLATLFVAAAAFVYLGNVTRISLGIVLYHRHGIDTFGHSAHELLGWSVFVVCMALVVSADHLLGCFFDPQTPASGAVAFARTPGARASEVSTSSARLVARLSAPRWPAWIGAVLFLGFGMVQAVQAWQMHRIGAFLPQSRLPIDATFSLPAQVAGWQRVDRDPKNPLHAARPELRGRRSTTWIYAHGGLIAIVALDYPFSGYHDVCDCYKASGWRIMEDVTNDTMAAEPFRSVRMQNPPATAALLFGLFDEQGRWLRSTSPRGLDTVQAKFIPRRVVAEMPSCQVQVLLQSYTPLTPVQIEAATALFRESSRELARQVTRQARAG